MKIDRLIGIVLVLTRKEKVTAPYLAKHFEVSRRTINRDIETLCMAGVPIITQQGSNGGISIQEGYKLDKTIFSEEELTKIMVGVNALNSIEQSEDNNIIIEKLRNGNSDANDVIDIELGSFYRETISEKIGQIKDAIKTCRKLRFQYYSKSRKSIKTVNPYKVMYKWQNWYLYAFCVACNDFRLYKLNRLWDLVITSEHFEMRTVGKGIMKKIDDIFPSSFMLKALFHSSVEYMLVETYGNQSYTACDDGWLYFERDFANFEYMLSWVLSFGDKVIVHEPACLIERMKEIAEFHCNQYR